MTIPLYKPALQLLNLTQSAATAVAAFTPLMFMAVCYCQRNTACMQEVVLPRVMEQIVQCKDNIAQQYLMQCVIQGFPDEFHVNTLDVLLGALPELQGTVKVHMILASMLDRLARCVCTPSLMQLNFDIAFGVPSML